MFTIIWILLIIDDGEKQNLSPAAALHDDDNFVEEDADEDKDDDLFGYDDEDYNDDDDDDDKEYCHEYGDLVLEPYQLYINSNNLWFIEKRSILNGGSITLKTDKIRLKHMNTNLYLMCKKSVDKYDEDTKEMIFTTTTNPRKHGTLFSVNHVVGLSKYLFNGRALKLGHSGTWIERGELMDNGNNMIVKGKIVNIIIYLMYFQDI